MVYPDPDLAALVALCKTYLRLPTVSYDAATDTTTYTFTPPLTAGEQATLADLRAMARFGLANDLTLAEFQAMKADLATGRAFLGLASPTQAQAIVAEKAVIRVLGALLRDS